MGTIEIHLAFRFHRQLFEGCSNPRCANPDCASNRQNYVTADGVTFDDCEKLPRVSAGQLPRHPPYGPSLRRALELARAQAALCPPPPANLTNAELQTAVGLRRSVSFVKVLTFAQGPPKGVLPPLEHVMLCCPVSSSSSDASLSRSQKALDDLTREFSSRLLRGEHSRPSVGRQECTPLARAGVRVAGPRPLDGTGGAHVPRRSGSHELDSEAKGVRPLAQEWAPGSASTRRTSGCWPRCVPCLERRGGWQSWSASSGCAVLFCAVLCCSVGARGRRGVGACPRAPQVRGVTVLLARSPYGARRRTGSEAPLARSLLDS